MFSNRNSPLKQLTVITCMETLCKSIEGDQTVSRQALLCLVAFPYWPDIGLEICTNEHYDGTEPLECFAVLFSFEAQHVFSVWPLAVLCESRIARVNGDAAVVQHRGGD